MQSGHIEAVIMAGGRGTRLSDVAKGLPKPLVPVDGKPILEHEIEILRRQNICEILITVSYKADRIIEYFGDGSGVSPKTGENFGVHISYFIEKQPLGNAGALFKIKGKLTNDFFLLNADSFFDTDLRRMMEYHRMCGGLGTIMVHPNDHPYDSGLIITDKTGIVEQWLNKEDMRPTYYHNQVNAGVHILSKKALDLFGEKEDDEHIGCDNNYLNKIRKMDLDRDVLKPLAKMKKLYAYRSSEYVKDMGTSQRYDEVCRDVADGIPGRRNLKEKQKAIFLDRDGTINQYVGFLRDIDDFRLVEGAAKAIRAINKSGYLAIVVTNQPVVARGEVSTDELDEIHRKMETLLGMEGAYIDALYYCPHHPDRGFAGEIPELKTECECRKPKPGMLLTASRDYHIDLTQSWIVGDAISDVIAGMAAGCKTVRIMDMDEETGDSTSNTDNKNKTDEDSADIRVSSLYEGVQAILKQK